MRRYRSALLVLFLVLAGAGPGRAQQPDLAARLPLDPQVRSGRLENGLTYMVRANGRPEKRAELMLVVNAGSVLEDEDQRGLAHFVEHMAFNGTRNFARQALVDYLESIGMRFGADVNAYTGFDETVYTLTVPTDTGDALDRGIRILEDWAHGVTFDSTEIEKERGVVIEEWRSSQGAGARIRDQIFPALFRGSRYAERLPIGTRESLESFKREQLVRFYREWYRPDLMAVIAVGDFDAAAVEAMIRERFAALRSPANPRPRTAYPVPDHTEPLVVVATDPEATGTSIDLYVKLPAPAQGTYGTYRQSLVRSLFNGMLNARLGELAQQADPPFVAAGSSYGGLVRTRGAYSIGAAVPEDGVLRGFDAVLTEAERVQRHGFTATELERQKRDLLRAFETAFAEREKTESAAYANEYIRHFLEGEAVPGMAAEFELARQFIPSITLAEVNALAREWMTDANRVVVVQAPRKEGMSVPAEPEIMGVFAAVGNKTIEPWTDSVGADALVSNEPPPGRIAGERTLEPGITEWRLSNGARVLLKPTDFKDDEVLFRAISPGGLSLAADAEYTSAGFSGTLVQFSGLGPHDVPQLQKLLAGKAAGVRPVMDDLTEGLLGSASPVDLETLFQLAWLHFTSPRQDSAAYRSLMTRFRGVLENSEASPEKAWSDTLTVTMGQYHPRTRPVTVRTLDEIDMADAFAFYADRYADAGDFTFILVGAFQPDAVRPLVERWLASLPASGRTETWKDSGMRPPDGVVEKVVRRGVEPKSQTGLIFAGGFEYSRENAHVLRTLGEALEIRLREILREELGGTYSVSVSASAARDPWANYVVSIVFGSAPDRADSLSAAVFAEIERFRTAGPDSATLQKVKEAQRRSFEENLEVNGWWANTIASAVMLGTDPALALRAPALIDAVTAAQVQAAAAQYLRKDRYIRVVLLPER